MGSIFDILGGKESNKVALPEGEGNFTSRGFVGPIVASMVYRLYSTEDLKEYTEDLKENVDYMRTGPQNKWFYYFEDRDVADEVKKILRLKSYPGRVWRFEMPTNGVVNPPAGIEKWGNSVSGDADVSNFSYAPRRHTFYLMSLPALVDAIARLEGLIDSRIWHADELLSGIKEEEFTDGLQSRLIGDFDANNDDEVLCAEIYEKTGKDLDLTHDICLGTAQNAPESVSHLVGQVKIHYRYSKFGMRQAELWAALGESNPEKYIPIGYAETDDGKKQETTSEKLSMCLRFSAEKWNGPLWGSLHLCLDPRTDAKTKAGKRLTVPLVTELFYSEKEAREAAGTDESSEESAVAPPTNTKHSDGPALPTEWEGAHDDWVAVLAQSKEAHGGGDLSMPEKIKLARQLSCTKEDLDNWWGLV